MGRMWLKQGIISRRGDYKQKLMNWMIGKEIFMSGKLSTLDYYDSIDLLKAKGLK